MDALFEYVLKALVYSLRVVIQWPRVVGSRRWVLASATVTAPPRSSEGLGCSTVEIAYSFRIEGELYTGLHEEPFLSTDSLTDYVERFAEGRPIVVRAKPSNFEVSVVREVDQGAFSRSQLQQPIS
jgi:hypothetical protein